MSARKAINKKFVSLLLALCMVIGLAPAGAFAANSAVFDSGNSGVVYDSNFLMTLQKSGSTTYLNTQGFSVFLCNTAFDRTFGDQKCSSMEMILHGQRIATDGDIRLSPTPEQWDPVPAMISHGQKDSGLAANESYSDYNMTYTLKVTAEPGGFRVSVNLDHPLPDTLAGRAGFNLEFLPSIYKGETYMVDSGAAVGVFPTSPSAQMTEETAPISDPITRNTWQKEWDAERGDYQATPLATAQTNITLAPESTTSRVSITSENNEPLSLYDGRNKAQNGWFVLRTLIPSGKTANAVVWHVRPSVIKNWVRDPVVTYSQVGYVPNASKVAVIELDPKYDAPKEASVDRLNDDGTYTTVYTGQIQSPISYTRYNYSKFDFSALKTPGMYAIEYAGKRTDLFPITQDAYSNTWQESLDTFLAEQMDHVQVREGYKIWHGASHLDDARQAPANISWFDGWSMGANLNSPYKAGDHIDGLNVGGWYDAGDFDIQTGSQISILQDLAIAFKEFNLSYDNLTVDEDARSVEMHRPDGIPDAVQQIKHGALQLLAQIKSVGHTFDVLEVPTLRQYTHLGDGSTETDNKIFDSSLGQNETNGNYSGIPDDRWAFTSNNLDSTAYVSLAAAAWALRGWDDDMYQKCLSAAKNIWNTQSHTGTSTNDYSAAVFMLLATYDPNNPDAYATYKNRITALAPQLNANNVTSLGWQSTLILPYMNSSFMTTLGSAVAAYKKSFDSQMASTPYGVSTTSGMWGGSQNICTMGEYMYFLHKAFPDVISGEYTLRAANYILGTHPCSSTSWVCGVGKNSKVHAYSNTRSDDTYIPGGVIPGYVVISPDFPECIDDFGMLWFEDETCTADVSKWIVAGLAADSVASELSKNESFAVNFDVTDSMGALEGAKITVNGINYQTNEDGEASFNLPNGNYSYTLTKDSYNTISGSFTVADKDVNISKLLEYNMSLTSVKINGTDLANYNASVYSYYVAANLPPTVTAQSYDGVTVSISQAASVPGKATVSLKRGNVTAEYTINFTQPPKLNFLSVDGKPISGFNPATNEYFVPLSAGYTSFPTVTGTADAQYAVSAIQATSSTMQAAVTVKDSNGIATVYYVDFGALASIDFSKIKSVDQLNSSGWSIYNPNLTNVKFGDKGITVISEAGDWYTTTNTARNIITCNDASGNWQADLEVSLNKPFFDNFQQCAIEPYQDYDNYTKLDAEYNSYSGGIMCQLGSEINQSFAAAFNAAFSLKQASDGSYPIFYRLVKTDNTYTGYISADGATYISCGSATNSMTNLKLGLAATNNTSTQPVEVTFKKLTISHPTTSDRATLQSLYNTCKAITQSNYTDESWAAFTGALTNAQSVLESSQTSSFEISEAFAALTAAQSGLTQKSSPTQTADKKALQTLYNTCSAIAKENYTDASWTAFTAALNNAKSVLDKSGATQVEIDTAAAALAAAQSGLTQKSSPAQTADKTALQTLYNTCSAITKGNYTAASWAAFTAALNNAKSALDKSSAAQVEIDTALAALTAAKNGLAQNTSGGGSGGSGTVTFFTPATPEQPAATYVSDTTSDFGVSGSYQFRITSQNGQAPTFVIGTPGVFTFELVRVEGDTYYFRITAIGAPGEQAGIYVNGVRLLIATVSSAPKGQVKSDTTGAFHVGAGSSYYFKLTADTKPVFVSGSGTVFEIEFVKAIGKDYFFKVTAIGKVGESCGFYINSDSVPVAVATIG